MRFHLATGLLIALSSAAKNDKDCVKWGDQFQVPLRSKNVKLDCKLPDGRRVCCAAVIGDSTMAAKDSSKLSRGVGYEMVMPLTPDQESRGKSKCEVKKVYISSPQEKRDLLMSSQLQKIVSQDERLEALMKYVTSDEMMANSTKWLSRVTEHMQSEHILKSTDIDMEYLSRFHMIKKCGIDSEIIEWDEWIEPVNIAARHPFAFSSCRNTWQHFKGKQGVDRSDVDYVLLQSGTALGNGTCVQTDIDYFLFLFYVLNFLFFFYCTVD